MQVYPFVGFLWCNHWAVAHWYCCREKVKFKRHNGVTLYNTPKNQAEIPIDLHFETHCNEIRKTSDKWQWLYGRKRDKLLLLEFAVPRDPITSRYVAWRPFEDVRTSGAVLEATWTRRKLKTQLVVGCEFPHSKIQSFKYLNVTNQIVVKPQ